MLVTECTPHANARCQIGTLVALALRNGVVRGAEAQIAGAYEDCVTSAKSFELPAKFQVEVVGSRSRRGKIFTCTQISGAF
jgi:hypothetical protein